MATETRDLIPFEPQQGSLVVRPLVTPTEARQAIQEYEALKTAIVQPGDVQKIQGREFLKKSFWRRVATCFGVSLDLVSEERGFDEGKHLYYSVLYRAVAPNGRTMIGDGYCSTAESGRGSWPEHNVRATAHTRAKNRAISDLVGGGEVSADEIPDYVDEDPHPRQHQPQRPAIVRPAADDAQKVVTPQIVRDRARIAAEVSATVSATKHNPSALKARATAVGITGKAWGDLWNEYKNNLDGLVVYLDAKEASMQTAKVDETTEFEYALEGLPVSGMH